MNVVSNAEELSAIILSIGGRATDKINYNVL